MEGDILMAEVYLKNIENRISVNDKVGTCPDCGNPLLVKKGKHGLFVGCAGYRDGCRKTYNFDTFRIIDYHAASRNVRRAMHIYLTVSIL